MATNLVSSDRNSSFNNSNRYETMMNLRSIPTDRQPIGEYIRTTGSIEKQSSHPLPITTTETTHLLKNPMIRKNPNSNNLQHHNIITSHNTHNTTHNNNNNNKNNNNSNSADKSASKSGKKIIHIRSNHKNRSSHNNTNNNASLSNNKSSNSKNGSLQKLPHNNNN